MANVFLEIFLTKECKEVRTVSQLLYNLLPYLKLNNFSYTGNVLVLSPFFSYGLYASCLEPGACFCV